MANAALIQSGKNLSDATALIPDEGKAIQDGMKLITDQLDKNIQSDREEEKHKWAQEAQEEIRSNRKIAKEKRMILSEGEREETFELLDRAHEEGLLPKMDWDTYFADKDAWYKENKVKFLSSTNRDGKLKKDLETLLIAEDNWENTVNLSNDATISDASDDAKGMQFAIASFNKNNPNSTPMVEEKDGRLVYVLPNPSEEGENYYLPINKVATAKDSAGVFGPYQETTSFDDVNANYVEQNKSATERFRAGKATQDDVDNIGVWFDRQEFDDIEMGEIASSLVLNDIDLSEFDLTDVNDDGVIDGKDADVNQDGKFDTNEKKVLKELFTAVQLANPDYAEFQNYDKPVDTDLYASILGNYDAEGNPTSSSFGGTTSDGEVWSVTYNDENDTWAFKKGDGDAHAIGGTNKETPPSASLVAAYLGVSGKEISAYGTKQTELQKEKEAKITAIIDKLALNPAFAAGTQPPDPATDPLGYKTRAWKKNNPKGVPEKNPPSPPTLKEEGYTSRRHKVLSGKVPIGERVIKRWSDKQAEACGKDPNSKSCENLTKEYEGKKADQVKLIADVEKARLEGLSQNKAKEDRIKWELIRDARKGVVRLQNKQEILAGRGEDLGEEELAELAEYRKDFAEQYSFEVDTSQGANVSEVNSELLKSVDYVTSESGLPIVITSGTRTKEKNEEVGGVKNSDHLGGNAVDIRTNNLTGDQIAEVTASLEARGLTVINEGDHLHVAENSTTEA